MATALAWAALFPQPAQMRSTPETGPSSTALRHEKGDAAGVLASQAGACTVAPPGVIGWWPGDGTADDIAGGNNGTLKNGVTFAAGEVGQGFSFNGNLQFVDVANQANLNPTTALTIDYWVNPSTLSGFRSHVCKWYNGNSYCVQPLGGQIIFYTNGSNGQASVATGPDVLQANQWQHIAAVYDGTVPSMKIYYNGVQQVTNQSGSLSPSLSASTADLRIGNDQLSGTGGFPFAGMIDEVELFNRALSPLEIQSIYSAGSAGHCKPQAVVPVSYDMLNGETGANGVNYFDDTYVGNGDRTAALGPLSGGRGDLTDGITTGSSWNVAPVPYVGWKSIDPSIRFTFAGTVSIDSVTIHVDGSNTGGVSLPANAQISMGGTTRSFPITADGNAAPRSITFPALGLSGSTLTLTLNRSSQWLMLDEVSFRTHTQQSCPSTPEELVAWWPGEGNANDVQGGHHASATNAISHVPAMVGQGFTFGPGGFIEIPSAANLNHQEFTLDAWVRPDGPGPNHDEFGNWIMGKGFGALGLSTGLWWSALDGRFRFGVADLANTIASAHAFTAGQFHHVAGTYDGATLSLYVNGQLEAQRTLVTTVAYDGSVPWTIGATPSSTRSIGYPRTWNGVIDEVGLYRRALSASEIQSLHGAGGAGKCGAGATVSGRVADALGNAIAGVRVRLSNSAAGDTLTDADGNYSLRGLQAGLDYVLTPDKPGYAFEPESHAITVSGDETVNFTGARLQADLSVSMQGGEGTAPSGSTLSYTLVVASQGPDRATGVNLADTLPSGVTFVSAASTQGSCAHTGDTVSCDLGALDPGTNATVTLVVRPTSAGSITNSATVSSDAEDPDGGNNTASRTTPVTAPDLQVTSASVPSQTDSDAAFEFSWTVTNAGQGLAEGPWIDKVYLSSDAQLGADTELGAFPFEQWLAPGHSATRTQVMSIPRAFVPDGQYYLIVLTDANGSVDEGGADGNNWRGAPVTVRRPPLSDLTVGAVEGPTTAFFDQTITLRWTVSNTGGASTNASGWYDALYLSRDAAVGDDALQLPFLNVSYLDAGESYVMSADVRIPRGLVGTHYFIVAADSARNVPENNEGNNTLSKAIEIQLPPLPDLQTTLVQAPEEGFPGQPILVNWNVENRGTGNTPLNGGSWFDYVYIARDQNFTGARHIGTRSHDGGLAQGGSYSVSNFSVNLPRDVIGDYYIFVVTDSNNQVYEFANESNNSNHDARRALHVNATPPDLVVSTFTSPLDVSAGGPFTVNWRVTNQGAFEAVGGWSDTVYLSADQVFDIATDTPLATVHHADVLAPGLGYDASAVVRVPVCTPGTHYLFVVTDSRNQLVEFDPDIDADKNNTSEPSAIQATSSPIDLVVGSVSTSATGGLAGGTIPVTWIVTNNGASATSDTSWIDQVYFSPTQAFNALTALSAGSFSRSGPLAAGASYTRTESVTIPASARGSYYIIVVADDFQQLAECDGESNNAHWTASAIDVTNNLVLPDLMLMGVKSPLNAFSGQTVGVQWTVRNAGPGAVTQPAWNDSVYLSTDAILDGGDRSVGVAVSRGPLAVGGTYQAEAQATIPDVAPGNYFLIVTTDGGYVAEANETNNAVSLPLTISRADADLRVVSVVGPVGALSGQAIEVGWTVRNTGTAETYAAQWTDQIVISRDQVLDSTDPVIGFLAHDGQLEAGESYSASLNAMVPAGLSGNHYVFVQADRHGVVAESDERNNFGFATGTALQLPPPSDLSVTSVSGPVAGSPGEPATFTWMVTNSGNNAATGVWTDAVYLSEDDTWSITDALIGRVEHSGPVPAGQSYQGTLEANMPPVQPGAYYVIVRTDVRNQVRETDVAGNTGASASTVSVDVPELLLGVPFNATLGATEERFQKVAVPEGETLLYTLDALHNNSSTELYARQGQMVSRSAYDRLFRRPGEADQEVVVPETTGGNYYSLMKGVLFPTSGAVTLQAELLPFGIRSVSPSRIGDNGQVTITLSGARFKEGAAVTLVRDGIALTAAEIMFVDAATVKARFRFTNAAHGSYDVVLANPDGQQVSAPRSITIERATAATVTVNAIGDLNPRFGRQISYDGVLTNTGNVDVEYVRVVSRLTDQVRVGFRRPATTLPRQADFPEIDWENDDATHRYADGHTWDYFLVRDLEVGQDLPFTLQVRGLGATFFELRLEGIPISSEQFTIQLRDAAEGMRQAALQDPTFPLPPSLEIHLNDPAQWWHELQRTSLDLGYLSSDAPVGSRALFSDPIASSFNAQSNLAAPTSSRECLLCRLHVPVTQSACMVTCTYCAPNLPPAAAIACQARILLCAKTCAQYAEDLLGYCEKLYCQPPPPPPPPPPCNSTTAGTWRSLSGGGQSACGRVVRPSDPNDKHGPSSFGPQGFAGNQQPWSYTVNFENVPTATAAAQRVRVVDQLDSSLDWRTFRLREIGFGKYRIEVPDNRAFYQGRLQLGEELGNVLADVTAFIDVATGKVTWTLTAIDPNTGEQPASGALGLLPPNDESGRGQGYVTYTIKPRASAPTGTQITNKATITFDTEEAITTNTVINTVDAAPPASAVAALSANSEPTFTVSWSGDDPADGSGLQSFDIWVSENDGPYQTFVSGTTDTSATYSGVQGNTYRFFSVARDHAGNLEAPPVSPDAVTRVGLAAPVITWPNPADIVEGTALGAAQLNASANVPGTFVYTPAAGTILGVGVNQILSVTFTPTDSANYKIVEASVSINVVAGRFTVTVIAPNGGEKLFVGVPASVRWSSSGGVATRFDVAVSTNGGASFSNIPECLAVDGTASSCVWTPQLAKAAAIVRVIAHQAGGTTAADISDGSFRIVSGLPTVTVTSPTAAEPWTVGTVRDIRWSSNLGSEARFRVELSRDAGASWETLAPSVKNSTASAGSYSWLVASPAAPSAVIRVTSVDMPVFDASDAFAIVTPFVRVTVPNTPVIWRAGSERKITFEHNLGVGQPVTLSLSPDNGTSWRPIATVTTTSATAGSFTWTINAPPTVDALIRASWVAQPTISDVSDTAFIIASRVRVTTPNTAVQWAAGSTRTITWNHNLGPGETVDIDFSANGGASWTSVARSVANQTATTGTFSGPIPATTTSAGVIRVQQTTDPAQSDTSDVPLVVVEPAIVVTAPNTSVAWTIGSIRSIKWTHNLGVQESVRVELSRDGGTTWELLAADVPNSANASGAFSWVVTGPTTTNARIRITWTRNGDVRDYSDVAFRIP